MYHFITVAPTIKLGKIRMKKKHEYMIESKQFNQKFFPKLSFNINNFSKIVTFIKKSVLGVNLLLLNSNLEKKFYNYTGFPIIGNVIIDTVNLNLKQEEIINEKFLFSPKTTQISEVEAEIEEIEDDEYRYSNWKNSQIGLALGGSATGMWFAYKGLTIWEKWMKDQEQKDIEEEIQMTGTYINPGAGNVETSIDPITGKKIQIKPSKNDSLDK